MFVEDCPNAEHPKRSDALHAAPRKARAKPHPSFHLLTVEYLAKGDKTVLTSTSHYVEDTDKNMLYPSMTARFKVVRIILQCGTIASKTRIHSYDA
jgi:hypothetical protein